VKLHNNLIEGLFQCLKMILVDKLYAHKAIELTFKKNKSWGSRDRGFIAEFIYSIIRYLRLYDKLSDVNFNYNDRNIWKLISVYIYLNRLGSSNNENIIQFDSRINNIYNNPDILNNNKIIYAYLYSKYSSKKLQPYISSKSAFNTIKQNINKIKIFDGEFNIVSYQLRNYNINKIILIDDIFQYYNQDMIIDCIYKNNNKNNTYIFWKDKLDDAQIHPHMNFIHKYIINSNEYFKIGLPCDNLPVNKYIKCAKII